MNVQKAAVVGAGTMGAGIACALALAGIEVILKDVKQEFVDRGLANIKKMFESRVKKEVLSQAEAERLLKLVTGSTGYDGFGEVDIVIEAAIETINLKLDIFKELDKHCPAHAILASNTSALSISEIAAATRRPDKVVGMHFFNPAQTMKLVEVIPGVRTSETTVKAATELCKRLQKTPVRVEECPGFLVNRVLFPYLNEALYVLEEGIADAETIDKAAVEFGLPMGPFTLFDMTGIDVCAHVTNFLYNEYGPRFEPAPVLKALVDKGFLGQKSGAGFFMHTRGVTPGKDQPKQINPELKPIIDMAHTGNGRAVKRSRPFDVYRIILPMFNEVMYAIEEGVVKPEDVDLAMANGTGLKRGLLSLAREKGFEWLLKELDSYQELYGERFRACWLLRKLVRGGIHDFADLNQTPVGAK
jgi:3-hydroxyacyl-CoA dehydrogenase